MEKSRVDSWVFDIAQLALKNKICADVVRPTSWHEAQNRCLAVSGWQNFCGIHDKSNFREEEHRRVGYL